MIDAGYGHNTSFLLKRENRNLKYWGGLAKNPTVLSSDQEDSPQIIRLGELVQTLPQEAFTDIQLELDKTKTLWVVTKEVEISALTNWKGEYCYGHKRFNFLSSHWYWLLYDQCFFINCHTPMDSWYIFSKKLSRSCLQGSQGMVRTQRISSRR